MTVRQALADARERAGSCVARSAGRGGSFVAQPKVERDVGTFSRALGAAASPGRHRRRPAPLRGRGAAGEAVGSLQLGLGDPVAEIVRVRLADGEPFALERSTFPLDRFPGLLRARSDRLPVRPAVGALFGAADPRGRAHRAGARRRRRVQDTRGRARGAADARRAHRLRRPPVTRRGNCARSSFAATGRASSRGRRRSRAHDGRPGPGRRHRRRHRRRQLRVPPRDAKA